VDPLGPPTTCPPSGRTTGHVRLPAGPRCSLREKNAAGEPATEILLLLPDVGNRFPVASHRQALRRSDGTCAARKTPTKRTGRSWSWPLPTRVGLRCQGRSLAFAFWSRWPDGLANRPLHTHLLTRTGGMDHFLRARGTSNWRCRVSSCSLSVARQPHA